MSAHIWKTRSIFRNAPISISVSARFGAGYVLLVACELTGMSQRRLADAVGTSQPALARLETGDRMPSVRTLLRVAEAAGFDLLA